MWVKNLLLVLGVSFLLIGCAANQYPRQGEAHAQASVQRMPTNLGVRYLLGRGVEQNDSKAFSYFLVDANKEDVFAQNQVAYMYAAGKGTAQNYSKALEYYEKAANHGLASAQYNLGLMYLYGLGTESNKDMALQWIRKSAANGFEPAKTTLIKIEHNV